MEKKKKTKIFTILFIVEVYDVGMCGHRCTTFEGVRVPIGKLIFIVLFLIFI